MASFFIDFHCHPSMKPYGKSFNNNPIGANNANAHQDTSIWHYDAPNLFDRAIQGIAGICKFSQADFSTLAFGEVRIVCASLYPLERGFFNNRLGTEAISDLVDNFITGVGRARVNAVQNVTNYFEDLQREYNFYTALHDQYVETVSGKFKYVIVRNYSEIQKYLSEGVDKGDTIFVIITIEGLHVLNSDIDAQPDAASFLNNLAQVKAWPFPPFFVTFSHHFYNKLCGHAKSLTDIVGWATDQSDGINTGFTPLGKQVVRELLSDRNGRRIYVDIKHMSARGRQEYFQLLETDYPGQDIPIIISHGAANGYQSMTNLSVHAQASLTGNKLLHDDINFYDDEIIRVAKSKGIMGLQLDERRVASKETVRQVKHSVSMGKIRHYRAELLWNQVQHIAELLDRNNLPAWDCIALGTDFEGIINPLNGYLTAETIVQLEQYLERYAYNYMNGPGKNLQYGNNNAIKADEIMNKIFNSNGMNFINRYF
ncbi:MAG TPA: membrane dipeptidase, partial [Cyclobacteriaceae bacterium]|jgi:microsomal dipeptidase-like Zn-dependent dipeptidase|nr:membrane dipeptidase [Cyclobacteriaceae bacterium]